MNLCVNTCYDWFSLFDVYCHLGNQNTYSDIGTSDSELQMGSQLNPMHVFVVVLLVVWGFLYINGTEDTFFWNE